MPKTRRKRRYAVPIGGLFVFMAVLGVITVIFLCIRLTALVLDNSPEKQMFEDIVRPVVMFNPAPFEKPTDITNDSLLMYSMWSTLMGEKHDTYQFGENGELVVPASDLDVAANKLFGPEVKLEHKSFGELDMFYYYDEAISTYSAPVTAQLNVYTPEVISITKKGEYIELNVGYISPGISWQTDFSGGRNIPTPEKHMNYLMLKSKDGYQIAKLQDPVNLNIIAPPADTNQQDVETALPVIAEPPAEGRPDGEDAVSGEDTGEGEDASGDEASGEDDSSSEDSGGDEASSEDSSEEESSSE